MDQDRLIQLLIKKGNELSALPRQKIKFTGNPQADDLLNNLEQFPHLFVLGCVMDRQIKSEKAWLIVYYLCQEIGGHDFGKMLKLELNYLKEVFKRKALHRFNDIMAKNFYSAVQLIHNKYKDDASNIWKDNPKSATVVRRFLEFEGVGIKIATMATNILAREFKIAMQDWICIDISPDVHVKRVFTRLGLIPKDAKSNDELIYCAREFNPEYPGIFDFPAFDVGRNYCKPQKPKCEICYLKEFCPKNI